MNFAERRHQDAERRPTDAALAQLAERYLVAHEDMKNAATDIRLRMQHLGITEKSVIVPQRHCGALLVEPVAGNEVNLAVIGVA